MARKIVIAADVNADIPEEMRNACRICILPQYYRFDQEEEVYGDEKNLTSDAFFARLQAGSRAYSMGCNPARVQNLLEEELQEDKDVLCVLFSSALSGSYQTVSMTAEELMGSFPGQAVLTVDSRNASFGQGLLAYRAWSLAEAGMDVHAIRQQLEQERSRIVLKFVVKDLQYLVRGGRLSGVSASIGGILDIKPILTVNEEGQIVPFRKVRGYQKAIREMAQEVLTLAEDGMPLGVIHACSPKEAERLREFLRQELPGEREIFLTEINPTIGAHIGPGAVGVAYWKRD